MSRGVLDGHVVISVWIVRVLVEDGGRAAVVERGKVNARMSHVVCLSERELFARGKLPLAGMSYLRRDKQKNVTRPKGTGGNGRKHSLDGRLVTGY